MDVRTCKGNRWEYRGIFIHLIQPACQMISYWTSEHFTDILAVTMKYIYEWEWRGDGESQALIGFLTLSDKNSPQTQLKFSQ